MLSFKFSFVGRQVGAIGKFYSIFETYKCKDIHTAMSLLYRDYEHLQDLTAFENNKPIDIPTKINWVEVPARTTPRK